MKENKNFFIEGNISASIVERDISNHSKKLNIGAHTTFLGQVRADEINGKKVIGIEYSAYTDMANKKLMEIKEEFIRKYSLTCLHIYHSIGFVKAGGISLFVLASSAHRSDAINCLHELIDKIKNQVPVWGKEILEDSSYTWKENQ